MHANPPQARGPSSGDARRRLDGGTTVPALLKQAEDWRNHPVWVEIVDQYDGPIHRWCRLTGLDAEGAEEVAQRVWIELARRLKSFEYAAGRCSFRGWLRQLCRSRAVDYLRENGRRLDVPIDTGPGGWDAPWDDPRGDGDDNGPGPGRPRLIAMADEAQRSVRAQGDPDTWMAYWMFAIEGRTLGETADILGKTVAATSMAVGRVRKRLRTEGRRLWIEATGLDPGALDGPGV